MRSIELKSSEMLKLALKGRSSFLKKRSKRLLFPQATQSGCDQEVKVFWFFFSKKNILAFFKSRTRMKGHGFYELFKFISYNENCLENPGKRSKKRVC